MTVRPVDSPEFRRWFGASKVVDERGEPLVVYHGSMAPDFDVFDFGRVTDALGFHFGTREAAAVFTSPAIEKSPDLSVRHIRPFYLRIQNPIQLSDEGEEWLDGVLFQLAEKRVIKNSALEPLQEKMEKARRDAYYSVPDAKFTQAQEKAQAKFLRDLLLHLGYDGVKYKNEYENVGSTSWIVFEPTQIKSAVSNRGTFDPNDPNILHGLARRR